MLLRQAVAARGPADAGVARLVHAHTAVRGDAVDVGRQRDHVRAIRIARVERERESEVGRQAGADVGPGLARVVGAVDPAVELHEHPIGPGGGAMDAVHAQADLIGRRVLGQVARREPLVAGTPARAAVLAEPDARGRYAHRQPVGVSRPGDDGVEAQPARAAIAALEEHAGVAARVERPLGLARRDHPEPLERRVAALWQRDALRLLPVPRGIVRVPDLGAVDRRRGRRQDPARARVA